MAEARRWLAGLGLPDRDLGELPTSARRFADGAQYRVEIPSVEGPEPFRAVVEAAGQRELRVHRISQGSGMMLLTDDDIGEMVALGREQGIEVCLFVGPRAGWDIGVQATAPSGRVAAASLRGADQLAYGLEDVRRGCELGVRSILVADTGQLWVIGRLKRSGDLPDDLEIKVSISLPVTNPATARLVEELGATTINLPIDLSLAQIAAIRQAVAVPAGRLRRGGRRLRRRGPLLRGAGAGPGGGPGPPQVHRPQRPRPLPVRRAPGRPGRGLGPRAGPPGRHRDRPAPAPLPRRVGSA